MMSFRRFLFVWLLVGIVFMTSSYGSDVMTPSTTTSLLLRRLAESQMTDQETDAADVSSTQATPQLAKPEMYSLHVTSHVEYRFANTLITSRLANPADKPQEIFFSVVLPETAFISRFLMEIKGEVYEAYVKEKKEAKQEYDAAIAAGLGAAHVALSARDSNRFTVSVNIEPMSKVTFNLTYEELLTRRLGAYNHVINLDPGQIVRDLKVDVFIKESRNITFLRVPELRSGNEVDANEKTKSNPLAIVDRPSATEAHISFSPTPAQQKLLGRVKTQDEVLEGDVKDKEGLGGQFVVQYDVNRDPHAGEVLINNGFFVHFFAPADLPPLRKHALFVLDVSGSMEGRKIEQLKEAMDAILDDLNEGDYFNIIEFSYSVTVHNLDSTASSAVFSPYNAYNYDAPAPNPGPTPAFPATPEYVAKAKEIVKKMRAGGGTNIYDTLKTVIRVAQNGLENVTDANATNVEKREPIIVFLTDGEPTVGETRLSKIFSVVQELNSNPEAAIFSLAFGDDADLGFLKKLSLKNSGFARKIYEASDAALQLRDFYRQIASPLLANVTFNYVPENIVEEATTKVHFHTLFSGSELVVAGKLRANPNTTTFFDIVDGDISGEAALGSSLISILPPTPIDFSPIAPQAGPTEVTPLERLWAYLTIKQLLEKDDTKRDDDDVIEKESNVTEEEGSGNLSPRRQALELALKYSFVTPLTSLVVVKPNETKATGSEAVDPVDSDSQNKFAQFSGSFGPVDRLGAAGVSLPLSGPVSLQSFAPRPVSQSYPGQSASGSYGGFPGSSGQAGQPGYPGQGLAGPPGYPGQAGQSGSPAQGFAPQSISASFPSSADTSFDKFAKKPLASRTTTRLPWVMSTTALPQYPEQETEEEFLEPEVSTSDELTTVVEESSTVEEKSSSVESSTVSKEYSSTTVVEATSVATQELSLIDLEQLDWLTDVRNGSDVTLPFGANGTDTVYQLKHANETLRGSSPCSTESRVQGKCVFLEECALNVFKQNVTAYHQYFCALDKYIEGEIAFRYAGTCCPNDVTPRPHNSVPHDVMTASSDVTEITSSTTVSAK